METFFPRSPLLRTQNNILALSSACHNKPNLFFFIKNKIIRMFCDVGVHNIEYVHLIISDCEEDKEKEKEKRTNKKLKSFVCCLVSIT